MAVQYAPTPKVVTLMDAVSAAANANSDELILEHFSKCGLQIVIANTSAVGVYKVQGTLDGANWVDEVFLDGSSEVAVASGVARNDLIHLGDLCAERIRVRWEGSGTGTITASAIPKA